MSSPLSTVETVPLCVDLDGTLVKTNTLYEAFWTLARRSPLHIVLTPVWLMRGQAFLWERMESHVQVDVTTLPYRREVLALIKQSAGAGREVVLVTGADQRLAERVASHIGVARAIGSANGVHLVGERKRDSLLAAYGERNFDYVADSTTDFAIWKHARRAMVAGGSRKILSRLQRERGQAESIGGGSTPLWSALLSSIEPKRSAVNLIIFVPLLPDRLNSGLEIYLGACLVSSAAAALEGIQCRQTDRSHPDCAQRPFTSGDLSLLDGSILISVLLVAWLIILWTMPLSAGVAIVAYAVAALGAALAGIRHKGFTILLMALALCAGAVVR